MGIDVVTPVSVFFGIYMCFRVGRDGSVRTSRGRFALLFTVLLLVVSVLKLPDSVGESLFIGD